MEGTGGEASLSREVLEVLGELLVRREAGEEVDVEALCADHPQLAPELRRVYADWERARRMVEARLGTPASPPPRLADATGPGFEPVSTEPEPPLDPAGVDEVVERLRTRSDVAAGDSRFRIKGKLGRGGMGVVVKVWDSELRRSLARKVLTAKGGDDAGRRRAAARFVEEAQISAQLEHPGTVPVHDVGLDPDGNLFFTMRLVRGRDLRQILSDEDARPEGWSRTRALGVVLKVCEAMAYAHSKGVVHRDLKPSNVMVGRFGETYVVDWGLARVLGRTGGPDVRPRPEHEAEEGPGDSFGEPVHTDRGEGKVRSPSSPLFTVDGDAIGTPFYMSPEQARGDLEGIGPRSDVYAIGAILYEILCGRAPYALDGTTSDPYVVLRWILEGPPTPVDRMDPSVPAELAAICDKAMARDPARRYPSVDALAEDLRAYLEERVVQAHRTGAAAELRKWVARNRGTAAALAALALVIVGAAVAVALQEGRRAELALRRRDESAAPVLVARADALGPVHPAASPVRRRWLAEARDLVARAETYEGELAALRARALETVPPPEGPLAGFERQNLANRREWMTEASKTHLERLMQEDLEPRDRAYSATLVEVFSLALPAIDEELARMDGTSAPEPTYVFAGPEQELAHDGLASLVADLRALGDPEFGRIAAVERELARAEGLARASLEEPAEAWRRAIASIADREECPAYDGLRIVPQLGLVPLWQDEASGLWEFSHVLSGERPEAPGPLPIDGSVGLVLVLVPGGTFRMGASPEGPDADPEATPAEGPPHEVDLEPYFLSKYEMTQAQWFRAAGTWPSEIYVGMNVEPRARPTNPVEHVSWDDCERVLARWSLVLPTEAQWERAARGGTTGPYWLPRAEMADRVNSARGFEDAADSDGFQVHGPVDALPPNPFGLHHVLGNVGEWCRDWHGWSYDPERVSVLPGTGEHVPYIANAKTYRGGGFKYDLRLLRVSNRYRRAKNAVDDYIGVRPARPLEHGGDE